MYFEVAYVREVIATCPISQLTVDFLESLFAEYDEDYDLSGSYDEVSDWVTELRLTPVYL